MIATAGWRWDWHVLEAALPALGHGAIVTVLLVMLVTIAGSVAGVALGVLLASRSGALAPLRWPGAALVRVVAAIPPLVLLLAVHAALPSAADWLRNLLLPLADLRPQAGATETAVIDAITGRPFASSALALSVALAAHVAGVVRLAARRVPAGLRDAGRAQGMSRLTLLRRVTVPETARRAMPGVLRAWVAAIMWAPLAAVVGTTDVLGAAWRDGDAWPLEIAAAVAAAFALVLIPATIFIRRIERSRWLAATDGAALEAPA